MGYSPYLSPSPERGPWLLNGALQAQLRPDLTIRITPTGGYDMVLMAAVAGLLGILVVGRIAAQRHATPVSVRADSIPRRRTVRRWQ